VAHSPTVQSTSRRVQTRNAPVARHHPKLRAPLRLEPRSIRSGERAGELDNLVGPEAAQLGRHGQHDPRPSDPEHIIGRGALAGEIGRDLADLVSSPPDGGVLGRATSTRSQAGRLAADDRRAVE
jgi:hypothetical protein